MTVQTQRIPLFQRNKIQVQAFLGLITSFALLGAIVFYDLAQSERAFLREAEIQTRIEAHVFAEHANSTIKRLNELLFDLRGQWHGDWPAFAQLVKQRKENIEDLAFQVAVIDRDGFVAFSTLAQPGERTDLSQRAHFLAHKESPSADRLFISNPLKGKVSGLWSIQFTRPIFEDSRFNGVIVISVSPQYFGQFAEQLGRSLADSGILTIVRDNGEYLARYPFTETIFGQILKNRPLLATDAPNTGNYRVIAQIDGIERIYGYYKLPQYGLNFLAGETISIILAPYFAYRTKVYTVAGLFGLIILLIFLNRYRSFVRHKASRQQLQVAMEQAEAANLAKTRFLANMSHEIRTPINAVLGFTFLCLKLDLSPRPRDYLLNIQTASESLLALVNDLLDFAKIDADKLELELIPFTIDDVLQRTAKLFNLAARQKGIELVIGSLPGVPPYLLGDPQRLGQVLINLLSNAVKFTEHGQISVMVEAGVLSAETATLRFVVRDSGLGISLPQQATLFNAFTQADSSTTRKYGGTGLGLALSQQLVRRMGGEISIESEVGAGSCFSFSLRFALAPSVTHPAPRTRSLAGKKVLIADDNAAMNLLLCAQVRSFGAQVEAVNSGQSVLERIGAGTAFDLLLIDWRMPEMDGLNTAQALRGDGHSLPIILVTGDETALAQSRARAMGVGIQAFLCKPTSSASLLSTLLQTLDGHSVAPMPSGAPTALPMLDGVRILVVEDNDFNRQVARALIELTGAKVETADDGAQALAAVHNSTYDLLLMDIQMPVMDGYTATRAIRQHWPDLPIIALTAHAMSEERPRVLAAGMNDILTKPILPALLYATLAHWLHDKPRPAQLQPTLTPPKPTPAPEPIEPTKSAEPPEPTTLAEPAEPLPAVHTSEALLPAATAAVFDLSEALARVNGDRKMLDRFLRMFRERNAGIVDKIGAGLALPDLTSSRQLAHALKGGAGTIGLIELSSAAARLEASLAKALQDEDNPQQRSADFAGLETAWTRAQQTLATLLDTDAGALRQVP